MPGWLILKSPMMGGKKQSMGESMTETAIFLACEHPTGASGEVSQR